MILCGGLGNFVHMHNWQPGEIIGYIGRVLSASDVTMIKYFVMQFACLAIFPAFFAAGLYYTIGIM
jgi:hypothetical protein